MYDFLTQFEQYCKKHTPMSSGMFEACEKAAKK